MHGFMISNLKKLAGIALAFIPAFALLWLLVRNWVNIPFWDEWGVAVQFKALMEGHLDFQTLILQHNESRKLFPRLVMLGLAQWGTWDVRREILFIFLQVCTISLLILRIMRTANKTPWPEAALLLFTMNLLLFTPAQGENLLWGIQMICFFPPLCLCLIVLTNLSKLPIALKALINSALCFVSMFSYANGMTLWALAWPVHLNGDARAESRARRILALLPYVAVAAIGFWVYFTGYKRPEFSTPFSWSLKHPGMLLHYLSAWTGSPLCRDFNGAVICGGIALLFLLIMVSIAVYTSIRARQFREIYPWLVFGGYAVISGGITAAGRMAFSLDQAMSSRYIAFSVYLFVALIMLAWWLSKRQPHRTLIGCALAALLAVQVGPWMTGWAEISDHPIWGSHTRRMGKTALVFRKIIPDNPNFGLLFPETPTLLESYAKMRALNVLPDDEAPAELAQAWSGDEDPKGFGSFDRCDFTWLASTTATIRVRGWAAIPDDQCPADYVVFVAGGSRGNRRAFNALPIDRDRGDVAVTLRKDNLMKTGFDAVIPLSNWPSNATTITAWAVDARNWRAWKLPHSFEMNEGFPAAGRKTN
jgi:hypothetical protein